MSIRGMRGLCGGSSLAPPPLPSSLFFSPVKERWKAPPWSDFLIGPRVAGRKIVSQLWNAIMQSQLVNKPHSPSLCCSIFFLGPDKGVLCTSKAPLDDKDESLLPCRRRMCELWGCCSKGLIAQNEHPFARTICSHVFFFSSVEVKL